LNPDWIACIIPIQYCNGHTGRLSKTYPIETSGMPNVLLDQPIEGVTRITLNRPEMLNAFVCDMYVEFIEHLERLRHDPATRVVVLTGNGRAFCSGHDLRVKGEAPWVGKDLGQMHYRRFVMSELTRIPLLMRSLPQPIICAVNGAAAGIGFALALASELTLAAQSAKFVNSVHNSATGHELGMSYLLPRAIGTQRAAEILFTMRPVLADEAERIGLVLRTVPDDNLGSAALELARSIMVNVPIGIAITKQSLMLNQNAGSLEAAIEMENRGVMIAQSTEDAIEKRKAFFDKREPIFNQK
jgi:enoyl-CoA hydratase